MRFRPVSVIAASALALGMTAATIAPAHAVPAAVSAVSAVKPTAVQINKISNKTVASAKATAKLAPSVTTGKNVSVSSKLITVKQGSKTRAKNKTSFKAKAGTYKVTTSVKYKVKTVSKKTVAAANNTSTKFKSSCTVAYSGTEKMDAASAKYLGLPTSLVGLQVTVLETLCTSASFDQKIGDLIFYVPVNAASIKVKQDGAFYLSGAFTPATEAVISPKKGAKANFTAQGLGETLTKTTTTWSKTKTLSKTQTVKVSVRKR